MTKKDSFITRLGTTLKNTSLKLFKNTSSNPAQPEASTEEQGTSTPVFGQMPDELTAKSDKQEENQPSLMQPEIYPDELQLPDDNSLTQLWTLWVEQTGRHIPPFLRMMNHPDKPEALTEDQIQKELNRLKVTVTSTANKRLKSALPKNEEEEIPDLDAQIVTFLTGGQMSAWLLIYPPVGQGKEVDEEMLKQALKEKGICYGLDEELLAAIPKEEGRYFHLYLIAQGVPPVRGQDGYVVDLFPRTITHEFTVDEFDRVDYMSLNFIRNVSKGEPICRIFAPTDGVPGRTVLDRELTAVDGKKASAPVGRNTELSEDGSELLASMTGHVEFSGRSFQVKPVLEIAGNVDYSTGNINFLGDVHIHGDVCNGFTVRAVGSITVDGVVESCTIEAGGDLIMVKGALGNNQAVIRSHRGIYTKYLENASVCAHENLQADCIMNCDVYSDATVQVRTGQGIIIGGNIHAAKEVNATTVGAKSEIPTNIILGGLPCDNFEKEMLEHELAKLQADYDKYEKQPNSPTKLSMMSKLRMKIAVNKSKLTQINENWEKFQAETAQEQDKRRLICSVAHPGTQVTIGGVTKRLTNETHMCHARLIGNEICLM